MASPVKIALLYASQDESLKNELDKHLKTFQDRYLSSNFEVQSFTDAKMRPKNEIEEYLRISQIFLFLLSPDFLASDYLYKEIVKPVLSLEDIDVKIIPILLRPTGWKNTPLGNFPALPKDERFVVDRRRKLYDKAFLEIATGISDAARSFEPPSDEDIATPPRSQNDNEDSGLVSTLKDHLGPVTCVTFTSDGELLVSDSLDCTIKTWIWSSGTVKDTFEADPDDIYTIPAGKPWSFMPGMNSRSFWASWAGIC